MPTRCKSHPTERLSVSAEKDAPYMLNFLWLLLRPFAWLARWLRKIFRTAFGQLSWKPPYWLQRGFARLVLFRRGHPILAAVIVLRAFVIAGGSVRGWRGYQSRPKPHLVYAQVAPIPVTPLEKELKFPPLTIEFSESAARLEDLKNPTLQQVRLDPPTAGAWKWINDRKLSFPRRRTGRRIRNSASSSTRIFSRRMSGWRSWITKPAPRRS